MSGTEFSLKLVCTDFDGTLHDESAVPPVCDAFQELIGRFQSEGGTWVINTGRDLSGLMEEMARSRMTVKPDFVVVVEREIYRHVSHQYLPVQEWNRRCETVHEALFASIRHRIPEIFRQINDRFEATLYADPWSPFCMIGERPEDTETVVAELEAMFQDVSDLVFMRNDVYARMSHREFNKGTALKEIADRTGVGPESIFIAGDHYNDLPMLQPELGRWLMAPSNAMEAIREHLQAVGGQVETEPASVGVFRALARLLNGL